MKYSLPFENPFELPENCVVDFAASNFSEDFDENVRTSFIYLRNIEYTEKIDFSGLSFAQKTRVLELYLNRELRDLTINELDAEIFSCLICSFGQLDTDFFTF